MIQRFLDPDRIDLKEDCAEVNGRYVGQSVRGYTLRAFELVEKAEVDDGIDLLLDTEVNAVGFHVLVSGDLSEESVSALESLVGEVLNRIRGVEYKFRKDKVVVNLQEMDLRSFECMAKVLYDAFKKIPPIESVRIRLILDEGEFKRGMRRAAEIYKEREKLFRKGEEEVDRFYICTSCQYHLPTHGCVISPEHPSPCGTSWSEARAAEELGIVEYYSPAEKGEKIGNSEYSGINSAVDAVTDGKIKRLSLHSVLKNPPSTGLCSELIIFYDPNRDAFGIVDRAYKRKTPLGLTFDEMERIIVGQQVEGFLGASYAYLKSEKFLQDDGGWKRVYWVSPTVYDHLKEFLDLGILHRLEKG
jgi:acetyl-CoA decarbonylase/synthase complex subunit beta